MRLGLPFGMADACFKNQIVSLIRSWVFAWAAIRGICFGLDHVESQIAFLLTPTVYAAFAVMALQ